MLRWLSNKIWIYRTYFIFKYYCYYQMILKWWQAIRLWSYISNHNMAIHHWPVIYQEYGARARLIQQNQDLTVTFIIPLKLACQRTVIIFVTEKSLYLIRSECMCRFDTWWLGTEFGYIMHFICSSNHWCTEFGFIMHFICSSNHWCNCAWYKYSNPSVT